MGSVFVDADACPVVQIIERISRAYAVPVTLFCDTNHILFSDYSEIRVIGAGRDAVDFALVNVCGKGDVVVTQDYGVAAMALGRGAFAIGQNGLVYTNDNIGQLLADRHLALKARMKNGKHHIKGPKKRTNEDDERFGSAFEALIRKMLSERED